MSELPNGWETATLGQVCDRGKYGWTTRAADTGSVKFLRTTDITKGPIDWSRVPYCEEAPSDFETYALKPRDILISRAGSVGFSALIDEVKVPSVFASYLIRFVPEAEMEARYIAAFLRSPDYWQQITEASAGIALANVNASKLAEVQLPLAPLAEQKRIADKLEAVLGRVDACRARLDRVPDLLKRFRQSVLAAATAGQLTEDWRVENHDINSPKCGPKTAFDLLGEIQNSKIKWASENEHHNEAGRVRKRTSQFSIDSTLSVDGLPDWAWVKLEDVVLMVVDCHNKTAPYSSQGVPIVRTANIRDGKVVWEEMRYVDEPTYRYWSKRCPPKSGDIIFTREAPMGEAAIIPDEAEMCLGQRTMLIRPLEGLCSARFLLLTLLSPSFKDRSLDMAVGTGVKHLRVGDVSDLTLALPPLAEQAEIVRRVEALFALADRIEARLASAQRLVERLTPATLSKAFRGDLVPQDPNDEPASVLLERLRGSERPQPKTKRKKSN